MLKDFWSGDRASRALLAIALFLVLVGSRAALVGYAGSQTPFMDEWDGDWNGLIWPYLQGRLTLDMLIAPFMEHRILFTRLMTLSLFSLSGYWDVLLQMIVNAILGAGEVVAVSFTLARVLRGRFALVAILSACLINVVPFSFDSILLGFNTHFYLLPILSLLGLWLIAGGEAWSARWLAGALAGAASFLCLASGALTLSAGIIVQLMQMASGRRTGLREGLGVAALAGGAALMVGFVPHVPESDACRARSVEEFLSALATLAGWPAGDVLGLLLPLPSVVFCLRAVADRPDLRDARWFNIAALAWVGTQIASLSFGRGQAPLQPRYLDILMLGLTIHFVSALWIVETRALGEGRRTAPVALVTWIALVGVALPRAERHLPQRIEMWRDAIDAGGQNVRLYVATGDATYLAGRAAYSIPYNSPDKLRLFLDAPEARASLPPALLSHSAPRNRVEAFKRRFLRFAPVWISLGLVMLPIAVARPRRRPVEFAAGGAPSERFSG